MIFGQRNKDKSTSYTIEVDSGSVVIRIFEHGKCSKKYTLPGDVVIAQNTINCL